ncbi:hypothetical protein BH18ACI5_BH18ACI5_03280 [soil metagenome]
MLKRVVSNHLARVVAVLVLLVSCATGARAQAAPQAPGQVPADPALAERARQELLHAWKGYKQYASGHDELQPLSKTAKDWYGKESLLMTPVDTLSTFIVMGMKAEAAETTDYIAKNLTFDKDISVANFEITIRLLGALVSNYQATNDKRLLAKADELATRLLPAFKSKTGMPYRFVNLKTGAVDGVVSNPAEIGTLILEWGALAKLTGKAAYFDAANVRSSSSTNIATRRPASSARESTSKPVHGPIRTVISAERSTRTSSTCSNARSCSATPSAATCIGSVSTR